MYVKYSRLKNVITYKFDDSDNVSNILQFKLVVFFQ